MLFKIVHYRDKCIGCNSCVNIAPQNWIIDKEDGKSRLIDSQKKKNVYVGEAFDCDMEANKKAAEYCPMKIIQIR